MFILMRSLVSNGMVFNAVIFDIFAYTAHTLSEHQLKHKAEITEENYH